MNKFFYYFRLNLAFTIIYCIEMVLKIVALTPKGYFRVGFNCFDCTICCLSLIDLGKINKY
ncbi:MAG: ion transporter [bacterium]